MQIKKLTDKDKKYNYLRSLLVLNGIRNKDLQEMLGVSDAFVSMLLHGKTKSLRAQKFIAKLLNMPYEDLWGEMPRKTA